MGIEIEEHGIVLSHLIEEMNEKNFGKNRNGTYARITLKPDRFTVAFLNDGDNKQHDDYPLLNEEVLHEVSYFINKGARPVNVAVMRVNDICDYFDNIGMKYEVKNEYTLLPDSNIELKGKRLLIKTPVTSLS